jgi:hypothetical protein
LSFCSANSREDRPPEYDTIRYGTTCVREKLFYCFVCVRSATSHEIVCAAAIKKKAQQRPSKTELSILATKIDKMSNARRWQRRELLAGCR